MRLRENNRRAELEIWTSGTCIAAGGGAEHCALAAKFKKGISHPGESDFIYYPELAGLSKEPTVDEFVRE